MTTVLSPRTAGAARAAHTVHRPGPLPEGEIRSRLVALLGDAVVTGAESREAYRHDEAEWAPSSLPAAVVRARGTADVATTVRFCAEHGIPVVARGAGTGLSGGANAVPGCVVVALAGLDRILEIDPVERLAVVEPGVVNDVLRAACAEQGLWYPPDPASAPWSTIGGNVATNAGGLCCVKYGVTGDYVLGLEVVTGTGAVVRLGRRTAKGVAGYDLTSLVVGSEGTLGIVTEVTLRLRPARPAERTVVGFFPSVVAAGDAVLAVAEAGIVPAALELLDRHCLDAVNDWKHLGIEAETAVLLLGRVDEPAETGDAIAERLRGCFDLAGASFSAVSSDPQEADVLFAARRLAYPAVERLGPVLTEDVCVPVRKVPAMLGRIEVIARRHDVLIANIAHAGDGNLHPLIITPPGDDAARERAQAAFADIISAAIELGGTVTGEHGVGLLKRDGLRAELSPEVLDLHRAVSAALDPHRILNPGKVFHR